MGALRQVVGGAVFAALLLPLLPAPRVFAQSSPAGWVAYYRPGGELFVPHPRGWQVQEQGGGAFLAFLPGDGDLAQALVYVKPQRLQAGRRIADVLGLFPREEKALFPQARISVRPEDLGERSVLGTLQFVVRGQPYRGALLVAAAGADHGTLFVISATERAWPAQRQTMAAILRGFAWMPPAAATTPQRMPPMQSWREPNEGAYMLPVPLGWQVRGGMVRPGGIDRRDEVVAVSPDGSIQIRLGDVGVPQFALPHAIPFVGAQPEGSTVTGGQVVMRYLPGHVFLTQLYLPQKFGALPSLQLQELPALAAQSMRALPPPPPMQGRVDAGAVAFELQTPAGPRRAWYLAVTRYQEVPGLGGSAHWWVEMLVGFVCPPGSEVLAHEILAAMKRGVALDPRWVAAELQLRGQIAQQQHDHDRVMNDIVARTSEQRSQGMERAQAPLGSAARGEIRVQDGAGRALVVPQTGSQDYYRVRSTDEVIATDRTDLPPFDFDRLWRVP